MKQLQIGASVLVFIGRVCAMPQLAANASHEISCSHFHTCLLKRRVKSVTSFKVIQSCTDVKGTPRAEFEISYVAACSSEIRWRLELVWTKSSQDKARTVPSNSLTIYQFDVVSNRDNDREALSFAALLWTLCRSGGLSDLDLRGLSQALTHLGLGPGR